MHIHVLLDRFFKGPFTAFYVIFINTHPVWKLSLPEMSRVVTKHVYVICEQQRRRSDCASAQSLFAAWKVSMPLLAIAETFKTLASLSC